MEHFPIGLHFLVCLRTVVQSVTWGKPTRFLHGTVTCFVLLHCKLQSWNNSKESKKEQPPSFLFVLIVFYLLQSCCLGIDAIFS